MEVVPVKITVLERLPTIGEHFMGVTNGFAKLESALFDELVKNQSTFENHLIAMRENEEPDYLEMDKAGWSFVFMLDSGMANLEANENNSQHPHILRVLTSGKPPFSDLNLGCGPPTVIDDSDISASVAEFESLKFDEVLELAMNEGVAELLMVDLDENEFSQYYWPYITSLSEFIKTAADEGKRVIRF